VQFGPRSVLRRKLDGINQTLGQLDTFGTQLDDFLFRSFQLVFSMNGRRRTEHVDPRPGCIFDCLSRSFDIFINTAGQARNGAIFGYVGHRPDGVEIIRRADRETGLDDIHIKQLELPGDLQLFRGV